MSDISKFLCRFCGTKEKFDFSCPSTGWFLLNDNMYEHCKNCNAIQHECCKKCANIKYREALMISEHIQRNIEQGKKVHHSVF